MHNNPWQTVNKKTPCPICDHTDWCRRSGQLIRCMRKRAAPHGWALKEKHAQGGTFMPTRIDQDGATQSSADADPDPRWARLAERYTHALTLSRRKRLAAQLGVTSTSLRLLGIGWHKQLTAYTFPQVDHKSRVVGISLRYLQGRKGFIKNGHHGLHIPTDLDSRPDPILVLEGASDTAACLSMELTAIGRPSNMHAPYLAQVIGDRDCIIIGDHDPKPTGQWPGKEGAEKVARELAATLGRKIRWALPPDGCKDVRDWLTEQME